MTKKGISKMSAIIMVVIIVVAIAIAAYYLSTSAPTEAEEVYKIGFVNESPATGIWYLVTRQAIEEAIDDLNSTDRPITISWHIDVAPADQPAVVESLSNAGYDLLILGVQITEWMYDNAERWPDTQYVINTVNTPPTENIGMINIEIYQGYYLAGMLAAYASETETIGFISAFEVPLLAGWYNAYIMGAEAVNPNIEVLHVTTNNWYDPTIGASSVDGLVASGADVTAAVADGMAGGATEHAGEKGTYSIGYLADMNDLAPQAVLASVVWDATTTYKLVIGAGLQGSLTGANWKLDMVAGSTTLKLNDALVNSVLTAEEIAALHDVEDQILSGDLYIPKVEVYP